MGIDPGTTIMGFGIIEQKGNQILSKLNEAIEFKNSNHYCKLKTIFNKTTTLIDKYAPDEVAIESPFYGKNVQSMLKLGRAQGVAIAAAILKKIPTNEYAPRKIKLAITGNGNASKKQVAYMVNKILNLPSNIYQLDITDALAVGICHLYQKNNNKLKNTNWKDFLKENSDRLV